MSGAPSSSPQRGAISGMQQVPVFHPSLDEMKDFSKYVSSLEMLGAGEIGLAKIVAPPEYCARKSGYADVDVTVQTPIEQEAVGRNGVFQMMNIAKRSMKSSAFAKMATSTKYEPPVEFKGDPARLEMHYWKNMGYHSPIYGADTPGSLTDADQVVWNVNKLGTILDTIEEASGAQIMGVNTAYLYFGMWKASFCWHTEDMDLYSINYIHTGAPKTWYCVPPGYSERMEMLAKALFPSEHGDCEQFLRHKMSLISPTHLIANGIPCYTTVHHEREFMITFPKAFHSGFNHGYNIAESTNFASERWIDYGKAAKPCMCHGDSVRINMDMFVKKYQPDQWVEPEPSQLVDIGGGGRGGGRHDSAPKRARLSDEERARKAEEREISKLMKEAQQQADRDAKVRRREQERAVKSERRLLEKAQKNAIAAEKAREAEAVANAIALVNLRSTNDQLSRRDGGAQLLCSACNVISSAEFVLQCVKCKAACHRKCMSEPESEAGLSKEGWECTLCRDDFVPIADRVCSLCPNVGGILRKCPDGRFVHTACAVFVPETDLRPDGLVGVDSIPKDRRRLACKVCGKAKETGSMKRNAPVTSAPIQCHYKSCFTSFHVSCAMRAGYCFQTRNVPDGNDGQVALYEAFCLRHLPAPYSSNKW